MGVNSPSMKTHRPTQGLGWCIETRVVCKPAFLLGAHTPLDLRFALVWDEFRATVFNTRCVIPSQASSSAKGGFTVQRGRRGDGGLASLFEVRKPPLGCDARGARPVRAPCLRGTKPSSRVVLVLLCWSPTMKRRDRRDRKTDARHLPISACSINRKQSKTVSHGIYQCLQ